MARIKPFKAVRPVNDKVHLVASRSYVSYSKEKLREKLDSNPFTFIHIINPDYNEELKADGGTKGMFSKVKSKYAEFLDQKVFVKDNEDSIYIYTQTTPTHSYTGIIASVSVQEYMDKSIKIHEATIHNREKLFTEYLDSVDFNAEPVLLSYSKNEETAELIKKAKTASPVYDFTTTDSIRHSLWILSSEEDIVNFQKSFEKVEALYIADGHHRSASSVNLSKNRNNTNPDANSNWFMAMLAQEDEMEIFGFHRMIRGFDKAETDKIINDINAKFDLSHISGDPFSPKDGEVHMYYFGTGWTKFKLKSLDSNSPKDSIDAEKLSRQILDPIMGITDLKNDKRVKFIPAKNDLNELTNSIDNGNDILFLLAPVTFKELRAVADADEYMPPKSTYIEPKLRSGLTIFDISDE